MMETVNLIAPYVGFAVIAMFVLAAAIFVVVFVGINILRYWPNFGIGKPTNGNTVELVVKQPSGDHIHTLQVKSWAYVSWRHSWMFGFTRFGKEK